MAYERKIYDKTICPRCSNSQAELRLDVVEPISDRILVYLVCPMCRLTQYRFSTTKKAVKLCTRIDKLRRALEELDPKTNRARSVRANITVLINQRKKQETGA